MQSVSSSRIQHILATSQQITLLEGMACIAEEEDQSTTYAETVASFQALANGLHLPKTGNLYQKVARINHYLFQQHGFCGDQDDYYNPQNSLLHYALHSKKGLPITLSAIYMEIARLADFMVLGIGAPGHFLIRPQKAIDPYFFVDPFHQGDIISHAQLLSRMRKQSARQFDPEQLISPVDNKQILLRMCMNLFHSYQTQHNLEAMLRNIHRAGILYPENPQFQLKQASILLHLDQPNQAVSLIEGWLQRYPNTPERKRIQQWTNQIKQQL